MTLPKPLPPGSTIGIIGCGQLGRMLASAAAKLGFKVIVYGPEANPPAADVAWDSIEGAYEDIEALKAFAARIDVATYEFENIPPMTVRVLLEAGVHVRPDDQVLSVCQDRLAEKSFLREQGVRTAPFFAVETLTDLTRGLAALRGPAILKTRRFGYDGKGQVRIQPGDDPAMVLGAMDGAQAMLEGFVDFSTEISQVAVRSVSGQIAYYDMPQNIHSNGILKECIVPANLPSTVTRQARKITAGIMNSLSYVGVMAVEFFWCEDKGLVANEIAPRVHNTGHWTVEACVTGQFEQHIRAIAGWPLGDPARHSDAVMTNLIGADANAWLAMAETPSLSVTLYGKDVPKIGRKMGHTVRLKTHHPSSPESAQSNRSTFLTRLFSGS